MSDRHERLRRSAQALLDANHAYWKRERGDWEPWHDLQGARRALDHALQDEEQDREDDRLCPCTACRDIGGVDPAIHEAFNQRVFGLQGAP